MSTFGFEAALKESINSLKKSGIYKQYADIYSGEIVCVKAPDGTYLSESGDILADQSRFHALVEMCAVEEVSSKNIDSETDLKLFLESKEL